MRSTDLLNSSQVAERFQVSRSTVARWVKQNQLAAVRTPGGNLRFRAEDVDAFLVPSEPTEASA